MQSERMDPLVEQIFELSRVLEENRSIIDRITSQVDVGLKLPGSLEHQSTHRDILGDHLREKYDMNSVDVPPSIINSFGIADETALNLAADVYRLDKIRNSRRESNAKLLATIKSYEEFIMTTLLPKLRWDIEQTHVREGIDVLKTEHTPSVLDGIDSVWASYLEHVNGLDRLCTGSEKLMGAIQKNDELDMHHKIYQKLVIIRELQEYLLPNAARTTS